VAAQFVREAVEEAGEQSSIQEDRFVYQTAFDLETGRIDDMTLVDESSVGSVGGPSTGNLADAAAAVAKRKLAVPSPFVPQAATKGPGKHYWCGWWPW
jgi:hypothetical protein